MDHKINYEQQQQDYTSTDSLIFALQNAKQNNQKKNNVQFIERKKYQQKIKTNFDKKSFNQFQTFQSANRYFKSQKKQQINKSEQNIQINEEKSSRKFQPNAYNQTTNNNSINDVKRAFIRDIEDLGNNFTDRLQKLSKKAQGFNLKNRNENLIKQHQKKIYSQKNDKEQTKQQSKKDPFNLNKFQFHSQQDKCQNTQFKKKVQNIKSQFFQHKGKFHHIIDKSKVENQQKLQINKHTVYFPYKPYDAQLKYMENVLHSLQYSQNAVLQSPTGTGKTLCLLSATLSWIQQKYEKINDNISIIYLSRTHSQLAQVQKQLQKTCFRPTIATFGSRQNFCIKPQLKQLKGKQKIDACNKGVKLFLKYNKNQKQSRRPLQFDKQQGQKQQRPTRQSMRLQKMSENQKQKIFTAMCNYYAGQREVLDIARKNFKNKIIPPQKLKEYGQKYGFCPYYYPNFIKPICNLFFMPYNYLLDQDLIARYKQIISDSILIFDQGHNVSQAACQGKSFSITKNIFKDAKKQLQAFSITQRIMSQQLMIILDRFQFHLKKMEQQIERVQSRISKFTDQIQYGPQQKGAGDDDLAFKKIFGQTQTEKAFYQLFYQKCYDQQNQIFRNAMRNQTKKQLIRQMLNQMLPTVNLIKQFCLELQQVPDKMFSNLEKTAYFLSKCLNLIEDQNQDKEWMKKNINHFRILVVKNDKNWQINVICLVPFLTFSKIDQLHPRNIIITSGTLSPVQSWQSQLGIPFPVKLVNTHVIPSKQLKLKVIQRYQNTQFNFSFKSLNDNWKNIYLDSLKTIIEIAQNVPNGILVILPSYKIMRNIQSNLQYNSQLNKRLKSAKTYFFEAKDNFEQLIKKYREAASNKGALLFCVCRGKISQGIDFPNQLCRAVIFIGIPFPNIGDHVVRAKKQHLNKIKKCFPQYKYSGEIWYQNNTFRAVSQAVGRVIRHINDYGCIFLIDNRYNYPAYQSQLPKWAMKSCQTISSWNQKNCKQIKQFFYQMQKQFGKIQLKIKQKISSSQQQCQQYQEINVKNKYQRKQKIQIHKNNALSKRQQKNKGYQRIKSHKDSNLFEMMKNNMNKQNKNKQIKQ